MSFHDPSAATLLAPPIAHVRGLAQQQRMPRQAAMRTPQARPSRAQQRSWMVIGFVGAALLVGACGQSGTSRAAANIKTYKVPTADGGPVAIIPGPDGAMWFIEISGNKVGRVSSAGAFTEYPIPTPNANVAADAGITVGPDGNIWLTEGLANKVARLTPEGKFTEFTIPTPKAYPTGITTGPEGSIWFVESSANRIGKITTGGEITEFTIGETGPYSNEPRQITAGPDGNLWFTGLLGNIWRLTPTGQVTEYAVPSGWAGDITTGPDGNLWFVDESGGNPYIGKMTPSGKVTEYPIPEDGIPQAYPAFLSAGNGKLWFSMDSFGAFLGSVTTTGVFSEFTLPGFPNQGGRNTGGLAVGPDGNIWYTIGETNQVVELVVPH
jgi:virginiamycin B lyase